MTDENDVRIERTLDAPIDLIWSMWTEAQHLPTGTDRRVPRSREPTWTFELVAAV